MMKALTHPGNLIIAGFVAAALGLLSLVYMATQVKLDMAVEGDYYQQEMLFDQRLNAQKMANTLGETFQFEAEGNKLMLSVPAVLSHQLDSGNVAFFCLSDASFDSHQPLKATADGKYLFDRSKVAAGHNYIVKVNFVAKGQTYYKEFKML